MNYGQKIAQLRKDANLTQAQLGKQLNVSAQAVSKWEHSQAEPDLTTICKLCALFDISTDDFLESATKSDCSEKGEKTASESAYGVCVGCGVLVSEDNLGQKEPKLMCKHCYSDYSQGILQLEEEKQSAISQDHKNDIKKKKKSIILGLVAMAVVIAIGLTTSILTAEGTMLVIRYSGKSDFRYTATLSLSSENALLKKLYSKLEQMGTRLEMSEVSISNPMAIKFDFNLDSNHRLSDFRFGADVTFPVKNVPVKIAVSYEQKASNANIAIPSVSDFIVEKNDISNVLATINGALSCVKNQNTYSIDVSAINDFDPGWNITATVDKYIARMYKNTTDDGRIDFNHSFVYKAHTDEDGKENFKFTIGNIENGDVYRISRKGSNTQTKIDGVSADGQFDYLTSMIKMSADDIDCIKTVQKDGSTFYYLYQNKNATGKQQSSIVEMINSNPADRVTDVENYFNEENNEVADTEMVVEMKDGQLVSINANTKFRYCPTGGEYTEQNVVLTNEIELLFNAKAEDAQSYIAPVKVETTIGKLGLNNATFYIL